MKHYLLLALLALTIALPLACQALDEKGTAADVDNVTIGAGRGYWDASVGVFVWTDKFWLRNLQLRGTVDLAPGLRAHASIRSNHAQNNIRDIAPMIDEGYLEQTASWQLGAGTLRAQARVGAMRYLRFPAPDEFAVFDQVPGIADLGDGATTTTGYHGELLTLDYTLGDYNAHVVGYNRNFVDESGGDISEATISTAQSIGSARLSLRGGMLPVRTEPLGRSAAGVDVLVGVPVGSAMVGLLYENSVNRPSYTGVSVTFPLNDKKQAAGEYAFDYARSPRGIGLNVPLADGEIGDVHNTIPTNATLVGEIFAVRVRTYWQNSQIRNEYEHRLGSWGKSGAEYYVLMDEQPWQLSVEALVSPHTDITSIDALREWEKGRQGPAELRRMVTYRFYAVR